MATGGIFLVSGTPATAEHLAAMLPPGMFSQVQTACTAAEARRRVGESGCGLVLINSPLPDDNGLSLARDLAARHPVGLLLLVKGELFETLAGPAQQAGIGVLPKPVTRPVLWMALRLTAAAAARLQTYAQQANSLRRKVEDLRLINRAKALLMEHRTMTEPEAHRCLEKQAMDQCRTRRAVAEEIIRTYTESA